MAEPLKNNYNKKFVTGLAQAVHKHHKNFDQAQFIKAIFNKNWQQKELKERMTHICQSLQQFLPQDYEKALSILVKIAPEFGVGGFEAMFFPQFVELFGRNPKHLKISLQALRLFTQCTSSEFAVRPFILDQPQKIMKWMLENSKHSNFHVRRLASEGCRPRLPWAQALPDFKKDPSLILPILENLKDDPELYVRRSVANNINDIAKDNPQVVIKLLKRWQRGSCSDHTMWIIRHGLRSLVKTGNLQALALLGFKEQKNLSLQRIHLSKKTVHIGESLEFSFELRNLSSRKQQLMVDYRVYYFKKNGQQAPKVFKLAQKDIPANSSLNFVKKQHFKLISTRVYHPGPHAIEVQVNGQAMGRVDFQLKN